MAGHGDTRGLDLARGEESRGHRLQAEGAKGERVATQGLSAEPALEHLAMLDFFRLEHCSSLSAR